MADEKAPNDDVLTSIARTVGTTAGIIVSTATKLTAKATKISKSVKPKRAAKKAINKKKTKRAATAKKKTRKSSSKKRK